MILPKNCHIKKIERVVEENGLPVVREVDRCIPETNRNTLTVYAIGGTTKVVFSRTTVSEGVNLHNVHDFNIVSGYLGPDDNERKRESKRCSLSKTRRLVAEYIACNPWSIFVTITLDSNKWNRFSPNGLQNKLKNTFDQSGTRKPTE